VPKTFAGLGGMQSHATSQQITDNEEEDEVLEYIIKPLTKRLEEMSLAPGYTEMWMDHVEHLASPSVYKSNGPIVWILWRREPPQEYHATNWESFINWITEDINDTIRAVCMTPEEKGQTSSFVEEYKKEPEQVTNRTLVEQNVTRTFTEY
jgi:hypothetical protein